MPNPWPKPEVDGDSRPFWEGLNQGELRIQRCEDCGRHIFYPRSICPDCFSDRVCWVRASGRGRIYSYTVVHRAQGPFVQDAPYVVAIVELEEGVRMMSRIVGPREEVAIEKPVRVVFTRVDDELVLPFFEVLKEG
ncbi:MAG: Zn-ribbon domain-containing OB-fold protein [Alicyclobacillus macrosporangiidus]|uniref:Zn-ribbon domain-containing OB-fold protein n=1 Tax=Alicyclobacillus macrosporangiidus TaxID=392015 RepID=UPI0026EFF23D|nr:Zn-ribbon domain-containing OB-fold protein [Alicyclobacillus macrosporangiidus]MCL6599829.1 Zn-ribbon domain-containing OB-fold protein [Alicyclobacillus macrosporangiidus]